VSLVSVSDSDPSLQDCRNSAPGRRPPTTFSFDSHLFSRREPRKYYSLPFVVVRDSFLPGVEGFFFSKTCLPTASFGFDRMLLELRRRRSCPTRAVDAIYAAVLSGTGGEIQAFGEGLMCLLSLPVRTPVPAFLRTDDVCFSPTFTQSSVPPRATATWS